MIYALFDNEVPYYIGRTKRPHQREIEQRSYFQRPTELVILDEDESQETFWIHQFLTWGFDLVNVTQRPDTDHNEVRKYDKHSPEILQKIATASEKQWKEGKHKDHSSKLKEVWKREGGLRG